MAKRGRPATQISVTDNQLAELNRRVAARKGPADDRLRALIILGCKEGEPGTSIAKRLGITAQTVSKWRRRFADYGLDGLNDEVRSGRPRSISDDVVQEAIDRVRQEKPEDASHWSTRSMSEVIGISRLACTGYGEPSASNPIWRRRLLSTDPAFVDKVHDVVGLYGILLTGRSCCRSTRRARSRHQPYSARPAIDVWTARNPHPRL